MRLIEGNEEEFIALSARNAPLFTTIFLGMKKPNATPVHLVLEFEEVLRLLKGMESALKHQCVHFEKLLNETKVAIGSAERIITSSPEGIPL